MHAFVTFIADLDPWRQHRVVSACHAFLDVLDPGFSSEPLDLDEVRAGWFFYLTTDEARCHLIAFFTGLVDKVDDGHYCDHTLAHYNAAPALDSFAEATQ